MNQIPHPATSRPEPALSPGLESREALAAFDALRPGESVSLVLFGPPSEVLACLQRDRKGQFDWTPTGEGPKSFQVEVSRRAAEGGSLRSVNEALSWDHDRLDDLEARAFKARGSGNFSQAKALYSVFATGLRRISVSRRRSSSRNSRRRGVSLRPWWVQPRSCAMSIGKFFRVSIAFKKPLG